METVEAYDYLGLSTVVGRRHPEADLDLVYYSETGSSGGAGDIYTGLDAFGRITDQRWVDSSSTWVDLDRFGYGYDRSGNRLYEENALDATKSELYHDGTGYDDLNRLGQFSRGTLNGTKDGLTGSASRSQDWSLDALGNWESVTDETSTAQTRTHDDQNRILSVSSATAPTYSANGEMTGDETGAISTYDAWGRLVAIDLDADATDDVSYAYDALFRKVDVDETEAAGGEKVWYYSQSWQIIEQREEATGDIEEQFVWSPVYVDAMVLRDRDTDNDGDTRDSGGSERLYVLHDANFNITAVANDSGVVQERYLYDPYGQRTVLDANWAADADGATDLAFHHGHQGGRHDAAGADTVDFRFRVLLTRLGIWNRQDPAEYVDGASLSLGYSSNPTLYRDPLGLWGILDQLKDVGRRAVNVAVDVAVDTATDYVVDKAVETTVKIGLAATHGITKIVVAVANCGCPGPSSGGNNNGNTHPQTGGGSGGNNGPRETFKDPADAIGDLNGKAIFVRKDPTKDPYWSDKGFTEHHIYRDSNDELHHTFYNPKTGEHSGGGPSSHID